MRLREWIGLLALLAASRAEAREVALSFDDCPRKPGPVLAPMVRAEKISAALADAKVRAVFFCNSLKREPEGEARVRYYADRGHLIANHTASHPSYNKISPAEFAREVEAAHAQLRDLPNYRPWFRFPFLHEGKDAEAVRAGREVLKKAGYRNGYVTIDTQDWLADDLLRQAKEAGKKYRRAPLCRAYATMVASDAAFFDDMSVKALGRSVKHVVLLHETDLNALCLGEVIDRLRAERWSIIDPDAAYLDPIAEQEPAPATKLNQGRVFALAREAGHSGPWWSPFNEESAIRAVFAKFKVWR